MCPNGQFHGLDREPELENMYNVHLIRLKVMNVYHHGSSEFTFLLKFPGPYKIPAIKELRKLAALGLKDAKDQVEAWASGDLGWLPGINMTKREEE